MDLRKIGLGGVIAFTALVLVLTRQWGLALVLVVGYCAWIWRGPLMAMAAYIHQQRK